MLFAHEPAQERFVRMVTVRMEQSQGTELDIGFTYATEQEMRDDLKLPESFG